MPEGPSIIMLKEAIQQFLGKKILSASGNSKIGQQSLVNKKKLAALIKEARNYNFDFLRW